MAIYNKIDHTQNEIFKALGFELADVELLVEQINNAEKNNPDISKSELAVIITKFIRDHDLKVDGEPTAYEYKLFLGGMLIGIIIGTEQARDALYIRIFGPDL